eukprot:983897-Prorocentrum_lima.AAC.1
MSCNIGWIVPVRRLTQELGMKPVWGTDKVTLKDQYGKELILKLHFGLPFMEWDDSSGSIRQKLAQSHLSGRHQAP